MFKCELQAANPGFMNLSLNDCGNLQESLKEGLHLKYCNFFGEIYW